VSPDQLHSLIDASILLIVAVSGAISAWTHWKVSQLPTSAENRQIAAELARTVEANGKEVHIE